MLKLLQHAEACGYEFVMAEFQRTLDQQALYVQSGRSTTLQSNHIRKCAGDVYFFKNGELVYDVPELGAFWESLHPKNSWGGNWNSFKDKPHFERRP